MRKIFAISILFTIVSCNTKGPIHPDTLIQNALIEKIEKERKIAEEQCRLNALLQAEIYVDSIIYEMTRFSVLEDSIEMIAKPSRPDRPEYMEISDPGPITPFKEKE